MNTQAWISTVSAATATLAAATAWGSNVWNHPTAHFDVTATTPLVGLDAKAPGKRAYSVQIDFVHTGDGPAYRIAVESSHGYPCRFLDDGTQTPLWAVAQTGQKLTVLLGLGGTPISEAEGSLSLSWCCPPIWRARHSWYRRKKQIFDLGALLANTL